MTVRNPTRAFRAGVASELGCYVYRLVDPRSTGANATFYVGKGRGDRVFDHLNEAEKGIASCKCERIREIWESGQDVGVIIHRHKLTDGEAKLVESVLLDLLPSVQTDPERRTNLVKGHHANSFGMKTVDILNHEYAAETAQICQPMALIKINRRWLSHYKSEKRPPTSEEIYKMVRGDWVVSPQRHKSVRHAAAVAFGLIREVFEITAWSAKDDNGRVSFEGKIASELGHLKGTHVNDIFSQGAQAPVRWFYPTATQQSKNPK